MGQMMEESGCWAVTKATTLKTACSAHHATSHHATCIQQQGSCQRLALLALLASKSATQADKIRKKIYISHMESGISHIFAWFDFLNWACGPRRAWNMILSLGASVSQSFGPNGATWTLFVAIFMMMTSSDDDLML